MPIVEKLRDKIIILSTFTEDGTQKALADKLDIAPRQLSVMINGSNEGDVAGNVPPKQLQKFAAFISKNSHGRLTEQSAVGLMSGPYDVFVASLFPLPVVKLDEVLKPEAQTLQVRTDIVKRGRFAVVNAPYKIPDGAIAIAKSQNIRFRIDTAPGRQLVVLYHFTPGSWMVLAPGALHAGPIGDEQTYFPSDPTQSISFKDPSPCYRFVFLELALADPPHLGEPGAGQSALNSAELSAFAVTLRNLPADGLRWRQIFVAPEQSGAE